MAKRSLNGLKRLLACMLILLMLTTGITSAGAVTVSADPTPTVVNTVDELEYALSKGGDIKLGKSITYTETLSAEKNVSIDLAGYDLKYNNVYTAMEVKSAEVTFCDSSETHTGSFAAVLECDNLISYDASGLKNESLTEKDYPISKLIFNGGIFSGSFGDSLINADFAGETIVINGGTFSNTKDDVLRLNEAGLAVNGGIFSSVDDIFSCESSNISVTNGDFSAKDNVFYCENCDLAISNGMFSAGGNDLQVNDKCNVTINGGEFTADSCLVRGTDSSITVNGGLFTSEKDSVASVYNCTLTIKDGSFKACYNCVYSDGSEVTIEGGSFYTQKDDVVYGAYSGITINGGDFCSVNGRVVNVDNSVLRITGGKLHSGNYSTVYGVDSLVFITDGDLYSDNSYVVFVKSSDLRISGGTFYAEDYYTIDVDDQSYVEINEGLFTSEEFGTLYVEGISTAQINGGTFIAENNDAVDIDESTAVVDGGNFISVFSEDYDAFIAYSSNITINGGNFEAGDDALYFKDSKAEINNAKITKSGYGIYGRKDSVITINNVNVNSLFEAIIADDNVEITVNGGTFNSYEYAAEITSSTGILTVNDGYFDGAFKYHNNQYLRGGYYTSDPTDNIIEPGFIAKPTNEIDEQAGVVIDKYKYKITGSLGTNQLTLKYNLDVVAPVVYSNVGDNAQVAYKTVEPVFEVSFAEEKYVFDKYYTDDKYTAPAEFPLTITEDTTLYGRYVLSNNNALKTVTVDYNGHGGSYIKTVKNVPYNTDVYNVLLCAFLDMDEYNEAYINTIISLPDERLQKLMPTEKGYTVQKYKNDPSSVLYGLKNTYGNLSLLSDEKHNSVFHDKVKKDSVYYLQWFKIIDSSITVVTDVQEPYCGQKKMQFENDIAIEDTAQYYIEERCVDYETKSFSHNAFKGNGSYYISTEFIAKYGYLFGTEYITTEYPSFTYNISNDFYDSFGDYYTEQDSYAYFAVTHDWGETADMTEDEIIDEGLSAPEVGYKWSRHTCKGCGETEFFERSNDELAKAYTVTVDMGTRMDNFVIENVKPGTKITDAIGNDIIDIVDAAEANDENYAGLASKPVSEYKDNSELQKDINDVSTVLTVTDHNITLYPVYYKEVSPKIIFNSVPVCGQAAKDENGALIAPDITIPKTNEYTFFDVMFKSSEVYPIGDRFTGGEQCVVDFIAAAGTGYELTNSLEITGADYDSYDYYYDTQGNKHFTVLLNINHVHNENSKVIDEILPIDITNPCTSPRLHYTKIICGIEDCGGVVEEKTEPMKPDHDWDEPSYLWSDDLTTVTAIQHCKNNPEHERKAEVTTTAEVTKAPTCENNGIMTYTATFDTPEYETQTTDTEIPATGHDWSEPTYTWADDYSTVTAERICKNDPTHKETEKAVTTSKETKAAKCEETGTLTYTAEFANPAFETQTTDTEIPAIGHKWRTPTYSWSEDYSRVYAERVCENDLAHKETEDVATTLEVKLLPTCEDVGIMIYTAVFTNPVFETQTFEVVIPAIGHDWGEPTYTWAKDYSTVTAERVCKKDDSHIETEIVNTTYEVIVEPTFEEAGIGRYTSNEFENAAFKVQQIDVAIPAKLCTVTFDSKGGTFVETQKVPFNGYAEKPDDPTKEGFTFAGWYLDDSEYDFDTPVTGDITLIAKWEEIKPDTATDTNSAIDTETNTETDTDTASDTDTDTETDTDTASDTETDTETDTDTESDTETDTDILYGDVNGDGKVTARDSMIVQRYAIELAQLTDEQIKVADVDRNGKVNAKDALYILRSSINLAVLPIEN